MEGYQYQAFRFISKLRLDSMLPRVLKALKEYFEQYDQMIYAKDENDATVPLLIKDITCLLAKVIIRISIQKKMCLVKNQSEGVFE